MSYKSLKSRRQKTIKNVYIFMARVLNREVGGVGAPKVRYARGAVDKDTRQGNPITPRISSAIHLSTLSQWASGLGKIKPKSRRYL